MFSPREQQNQLLREIAAALPGASLFSPTPLSSRREKSPRSYGGNSLETLLSCPASSLLLPCPAIFPANRKEIP
jgi:hypothetical protein